MESSRTIQIAIVEDDEKSVEQLRNSLSKYGTEKNVMIESVHFSDGQEFCQQFKGNYDVIFLDVCMPRMDGFATAYRLREIDASVVLLFLTNMAQYAIRGYEVNALDYLLKPLTYETFCIKFNKVMRILETKQKKSILISSRNRTSVIETARIHYIEIFNHQLCFHTEDGDYTQTGGTSLKELEKELETEYFARCHNCYLVNLRYVDTIEDNVVWVSNVSLPISRNRKKKFVQALMQSLRRRSS